jgi:hypothetical protein
MVLVFGGSDGFGVLCFEGLNGVVGVGGQGCPFGSANIGQGRLNAHYGIAW